MVEREFGETVPGKQVRQKASVPFLWEEKPGTPKKGWKLEIVPVNVVPPPVKLISSVPFKWEEKPGKPLSCFSQPESDSLILPLPPAKLIGFPSPSVYSSSSSPITIRSKLSNIFRRSSYRDNEANNIESEDEKEEEKNELFISSPFLLTNGLISADEISNAIPADQAKVVGFSTLSEEENEELEEPNSPASETESNTSSYATGSTSLTGASFLDGHLYSPHSGFLDKVSCHEKSSSLTWPDLKIRDRGRNRSIIVRRTLTLGELIQMSRKLSYRRKGVQISKRDLPWVII
ncbi:hypothetical protein BVC80_1827g109 [Macleaya cordata]|uniref:Hydroxyproline-rich glycoprotein family protein n=1 Tax=Macleaya cordata TaxID=56857 RepID=A0A200QBA0_MACCD|nr:hypothetical protein BVC80_1827g109 [Macleaya cordata]